MNEQPDEAWALIDDALGQLEQAWKVAPNPPLADLLSRGSSARQPTLVQLIKADQECRWRAGDRKKVEDYLAEWPELGREPEILRDLVEAECRTQAACDVTVTREELETRFPDVAGQIDLEEVAAELKIVRLTPSPLPKGHRLGPYEIVELLGQGAMGSVYLAEDRQLSRRVAIKVPHREQFPSREAADRFLREAGTLAALQHPDIVSIHHLGQDDEGMPFIVMQYIEGTSLDRLLARERLPPERAAELSAAIAEALHYAHRSGFVHRDLKPANVLLDKARQPHVADFGLAVHESVQRRQAGQYAGSLPYMAPEQVRGEAHRLDGRADIWALGVMLYEMLTGSRPFAGETADELQDEILHRAPKPPRQTGRGADTPPALERICLKCLGCEPADRYSTAGDLARELKRFLQPRRRIRMAAAAVAVLAVGLLAAGLSFYAGQHVTSPPPPSASVDVLVWNAAVPSRRGLRIEQPGAVPIHRGDQMRIEARLSRPMYVYLVWIDSQGIASPLFPGVPGRWSQPPPAQTPVAQLSLPEQADKGWPIEGPRGMETLVLLARSEPLPREVDLRQLFSGLPKQPSLDPGAVRWFAEGQPVGKDMGALRGPNFSTPESIDDPVFSTQQLLRQRLSPYFPLQRAVSFAADAGAPGVVR